MSRADLKRLQNLIESRCLLALPVTLSGGTASYFYFDSKRAALTGEGLALIAEAFLDELATFPVYPDAIGGLTMGADFITAAVLLADYQRFTGNPLRGSIVRKEPKGHGTQALIENELPAGTRIVVIDDVVTSGASVLRAAEQFQAAGYEVVGVLALIDRQAGGMEYLSERLNCPARAIFKRAEFGL